MKATPLTSMNRKTSETSLRLSNMRSGLGERTFGRKEGLGKRFNSILGFGSIRNAC